MNADPMVVQYIKKGLRLSREDEEQALLKRIAYMRSHPGFGFWAVQEKEHEEIIGFINLNHILEPGPEQGRAHLGYKLAYSSWGKGFGNEMCQAAIEQAFQGAKLNVINAYADPENISSIRILEKTGFERIEGMTSVYDCPSIRFTRRLRLDE
jgi:RimJ/RimL family protein N-acetyltransferase